MILKISFIFLALAWVLPVHGKEPTNAIEWFQQTGADIKSQTGDSKKYNSPNLLITESHLKPTDLNSVGIIPSQITGVDPEIWKGITEDSLFNELKSVPNLQFHAAQTFLKRVLISETNPPIPSLKSDLSGKLYLIAKLDKLIEIGALEEAETIINQVTLLDSILFERLAEISFLTGRIKDMCVRLKERPNLSTEVAVRVICLSKLNDWNAAALILSAAASLQLLDNNREILLINYLDPNVTQQNKLPFNNNTYDEIDFFLANMANRFRPKATDSVKYRYATLINSSDPTQVILAAEELARKKSINISTLFDTYRSNSINGSKDFWRRVVAVKNLDRTLKRNNEQAVGIALSQLIEEMYRGNLLFTLAPEYSSKLEEFQIHKERDELNDSFALIYALNGEIPIEWLDYQSKNAYIAMAFKILKNDNVNASAIVDALSLVHPSFLVSKKSNQLNQNERPITDEITKRKGSLILKALQKSSKGVNTQTDDLEDALVNLLNVNQTKLVKAILIEYLIHYSKIRA